MPKVSVIIPVYNVERYIERCARSLFAQTLDDMEYIFVDDSSSDSSIAIVMSILESYPHRRDSVTIIKNTVNRGPSYARNCGLELSTGEYVAFCDSDDVLEKEAYELMLKHARQNNSEIVSCGVIIEGVNLELRFGENTSLSFARNTDIAQIEGVLFSSLCNKLIKRELFIKNNIRFNDKLRMWDDLYVTFQLRYYCRLDSIVDKALYHYIDTPSSLTKTNNQLKTQSLIQCANLIEEFIDSKEDDANYDVVVAFIKFRSKELLFARESIDEWLGLFTETHKYIFKFKNFYGYARIVRYLMVIVLRKVGWNFLEVWSYMKNIKSH